MTDNLIPPHGRRLVQLRVDEERTEALKAASRDWPSVDWTPRQLCDLELLMNGAFSPLTGFLRQNEYESVRDSMRLPDGTLWPMPIMLDVSEEKAREVSEAIDTSELSADMAAQKILLHLEREGYIGPRVE